MTTPLTGRRILFAAILLPALLLVSLAVSLALGPSGILPWEILSAGPQGQLAWDVIVRVRLPRVILGLIAGAALSGAGVAYQAILRNPLADPYILGISGGAALGAVLPLALAGGASSAWMALRPATAFLGAILATLMVFQLSRLRGRSTSYPMLLVGWVANSFFFALILFLETVLDFAELQGVLFWLVGSLARPAWTVLAPVGAGVLAGLLVLFLISGKLNLLSLGEEEAKQLGVAVPLVKAAGILAASLITATVVSLSGMIGFVGLMIPHICRLLLGPDHRILIPAAVFIGGSFLVLADAIARVAFAPAEIPVGVITALAGGPFFLWLYRTRTGGPYFE